MLEWTVSAQEAFQNAKRLLAAAVPLQHPAPNAELSLATDTSDTHIGGVMQQKSGNHWRPLGFFSRKLTDTESRYSTFDRELLAAHAAINISTIFAKVEHFNFGQITNHLSLPFLVFQPPFHPDNNAIWHSFQNLTCKCCICLVCKMSLQIFCPAQIKQPLDLSPPHQRQTQWISKRLPPNKTVAQKRSVCSAAHPLNWLSARQALNA